MYSGGDRLDTVYIYYSIPRLSSRVCGGPSYSYARRCHSSYCISGMYIDGDIEEYLVKY